MIMNQVYIKDNVIYEERRKQVITMEHYQKAAMRTLSGASADAPLLTCALGLAGEGGEIADHVKKVLFHGHETDPTKLVKELGDVLWYVACGAHALGISLEEIAERNIKKLQVRYPSGFETSRSINKDESKE